MRFRPAMRAGLATAALLATAAEAHSVSNEVTANSTQSTDTNPRSGSVGDSLRAGIDLGESFDLNLGATLTSQHNDPSPLPNQSGSAAVAMFSLGLDWNLNDNWSFGVSGAFSPQTTEFVDAPIPLVAGTGIEHIRSLTSEVSAGIDASYDTAGESDLEWSFGAGVNLTRFDIDQTVPRVTNASGVVLTDAQVRTEVAAECARRPNLANCGRRVLRALRATPFTLDEQEFSLSATAIVKKDTDLTLSADYYHYSQDATDAAYASLIFNGRGGAGVPVAPLQYMIRPEVAHRFGDLSAKVWVQAGKYVSGIGDNTAGLGLRVQYKFTRTFRGWVSALAQRDVDEQANATRSVTISLGVGYRF